MAAATTIIGGSALALSAAQTVKGLSDSAQAKKALNNYDRQTLKNSFEDMPISTAGYDLLREESARTTNSLISSVTRGGSRAVTANVGRIAASNTDANQRAAMDIDQQYQDRNRMIAGENSRIQGMYERREEMDLAGIGAQMQAGRETAWNGLSGMQSALSYGANNGMFGKGEHPAGGDGGGYRRPFRFRTPRGAFATPDHAEQGRVTGNINRHTSWESYNNATA